MPRRFDEFLNLGDHHSDSLGHPNALMQPGFLALCESTTVQFHVIDAKISFSTSRAVDSM
jgi:hypothetical protein